MLLVLELTLKSQSMLCATLQEIMFLITKRMVTKYFHSVAKSNSDKKKKEMLS